MPIKIRTSYSAEVATFHPALEARRAKDMCDRLYDQKVADHEIVTVSTDALSMYEYYGRNVLGLDIHYYLEDGEVSFQRMFASFNESYDVIEQYGRDIDAEERGKVVTAYVYDLSREHIYPAWSYQDGAYTMPEGKMLHRCRAKLYTLDPIAEMNGPRKGFTLTWHIRLDGPNPLLTGGINETAVRPVVIFQFPDGRWQTTFSRHRYEATASPKGFYIRMLCIGRTNPIAEPSCGWEAMCVNE